MIRGGQERSWKGWKECPISSRPGLWICLVWGKGGSAATSLVSTASWQARGQGGVHLFSLVPSVHGNGSKLHHERSRLDIRRCFFTKGMVISWNRLRREVAGVKNLSVFKRHLENACNNMLSLDQLEVFKLLD